MSSTTSFTTNHSVLAISTTVTTPAISTLGSFSTIAFAQPSVVASELSTLMEASPTIPSPSITTRSIRTDGVLCSSDLNDTLNAPSTDQISVSAHIPDHVKNAPTLILRKFGNSDHPLPRYGTEILYLEKSEIRARIAGSEIVSPGPPTISPKDFVRMGKGELYQLRELKGVKCGWAFFHCDRVDDLGDLVFERGFLFAVEERRVKRRFRDRCARYRFEFRCRFCCA